MRPALSAKRRAIALALVAVCALVTIAVLPRAGSDAASGRQLTLGISSLPYNHFDNVDFTTQSYGRAPAIWSVWCDWGRTNKAFPVDILNGLRDRGIVPLVIWEPVIPGQTNFYWQDVIGGDFDPYIRQWATDARDWGGIVLLRFAHEMDGAWFPWGNGRGTNDAALFKDAWRHVWNIFNDVGANNVKFLWSPFTPRAGWYPGDNYVDYIGFSAFNWGGSRGWKSADQILAYPVSQAMNIADKPIIVAELGSTSIGGDKAQWVTNAYRDAYDHYPRIKAILYFDINTAPGQVDWRLHTPPEARLAYRDLLTQGQFQGGMTAPTVTLSLPANNNGAVTPNLSATDAGGAGIMAWYLSESPDRPAITSPAWQSIKPDTFELSNGNGTKTVYAWVKDRNGVVSPRDSATTTTTRTNPTPPPPTATPTRPPTPEPTPTATPRPTGTPNPTPTPTPTATPTPSASPTTQPTQPPGQPGGAIVADDFSRTLDSGLGRADVGGSYQVTTSDFATDGQHAEVKLRAAIAPSALLSSPTAQDVDVSVSFALPRLPAGSGNVWFYAVARRTAAGDEYRVKAQISSNGSVRFGISRVVNGAETPIAPMAAVSGLSAAPGRWIRIHARATTSGSSTTWQMRAWNAANTEPSTWPITVSDTTATLQGPGSFGIRAFSERSLSNLPLTLLVDALRVVPISKSSELAHDDFGRTVTSGLGRAPNGGRYTVNGPGFNVDGTNGNISIPAGSTREAFLPSVSARDVDIKIKLRLRALPQGNGNFWFYLVARRMSLGNEYRAKVRIFRDGHVTIGLSRVVGGVERPIAQEVTVPNLTAAAGKTIRLRLLVRGSNATALSARAWDASRQEPAIWQVKASDSTAALSGAGSIGFTSYLSSTVTNAAYSYRVDDLLAMEL